MALWLGLRSGCCLSMNKIAKWFGLFSALLNGYQLFIWLYVFQKYSTHIERKDAFLSFYYGLSVLANTFVCLLLTVVSIIALALYSKGMFWRVLIAIQFLFALLFLWQLL